MEQVTSICHLTIMTFSLGLACSGYIEMSCFGKISQFIPILLLNKTLILTIILEGDHFTHVG